MHKLVHSSEAPSVHLCIYFFPNGVNDTSEANLTFRNHCSIESTTPWYQELKRFSLKKTGTLETTEEHITTTWRIFHS